MTTITYEIQSGERFDTLDQAKSEAESLISEGQGDSFKWISDWEYGEDEASDCLYREYKVDGRHYDTEILAIYS